MKYWIVMHSCFTKLDKLILCFSDYIRKPFQSNTVHNFLFPHRLQAGTWLHRQNPDFLSRPDSLLFCAVLPCPALSVETVVMKQQPSKPW